MNLTLPTLPAPGDPFGISQSLLLVADLLVFAEQVSEYVEDAQEALNVQFASGGDPFGIQASLMYALSLIQIFTPDVQVVGAPEPYFNEFIGAGA